MVYAAADSLMSIGYPLNGYSVSYTRDADGRIASVNSSDGMIVTSINYLPFGPATQYAFAAGAQTLTKTYDANYRATDVVGNALNLHFVRNAVGDITAEGNAAGVPTPNESYVYDPLYRLQQVNDATGAPWQAYSYDKTGDRLEKTTAGIGTDTYQYQGGTHRLINITGAEPSARAVDANGNTTALQTNGWMYGLGYNDTNRLTVVQRSGSPLANYIYNGLGERIIKTVNGSGTLLFAYDESGRSLGYATSDGYGYAYIWADNTLVATQDGPTSADTHFIYTDQLGTPRAVTDSTGAVVWDWPYNQNPFGEAPASGNGYTLNLRFPGQYFDQEDGLSYNYFRDYESGTGRYIQSDPLGLIGDISTYAYVGGNPISLVDPLGLGGPFGLSVGQMQGLAAQQMLNSAVSNVTTPSAGGISVAVSTVNPLTSGGGGVYGLNLEYSADNGLHLYAFHTPSKCNSAGLGAGISASGNIAIGSGPWSGASEETDASYGPVGVGFFNTPDDSYMGESLGVGAPLPVGIQQTTAIYNRIW